MAIYELGWELSSGSEYANGLILDFPSRLWYFIYKPPSLWHSVIEAQTDQYNMICSIHGQ